MSQEVEIIEIKDIRILKNEFSILLVEYFSWMFKGYNKNYPNEWEEFLKKTKLADQFSSKSPLENYVEFLLTESQLEKYLPPNGNSFVAKIGTKSVGMGSVCNTKEKKIGEIKRLYVCPLYQGKKIGKKLFKKTLTKAKECGFEKLRLETIQFMETASKMYMKYGFKEIEQYEGSEAPEGLSQLNTYLELDI